MADDPDNLALVMLRDIRVRLVRQDKAIKDLRSDVVSWTDTLAQAVGFAMHANIRGSAIEGRLDTLET